MKVHFDTSRSDHQVCGTFPFTINHMPELDTQALINFSSKGGNFDETGNSKSTMLLNKQGGKRSAREYPYAIAGVNVTFMIMQMLDLDSSNGVATKPSTFVRSVFMHMLSGRNTATMSRHV
ncbi:unnamed protein product [Linum tenue]|uniref:ELMO domain-containing protein n=1 Tax=Linum tenue TaxID=586396 RepID=A0AAV0H778_9ROSI|nr:unnamed protein product [Linum tenue]